MPTRQQIWVASSAVASILALIVIGSSMEAATLRWDESGPGNWNSTHWVGGAGAANVPNETIDAVVPTDVVTVGTGGGSALSLTVTNGGGIAIAAGESLSVVDDVDFASGTTLGFGHDAAFAAGRGTVDSLRTRTGITSLFGYEL